MKRYETLETFFCKVDLSFAQKILNEPYHPPGSRGRPPRNPLGLFKAHLVRRVKHIPSDRMLVRQMWKDPRLKKICDIEDNKPPYGIAVLSRFRSKVGPERLSRIVDQAVEVLVAKGRIKGEALALDSTFIKAYSRRNLDNRTGYIVCFGTLAAAASPINYYIVAILVVVIVVVVAFIAVALIYRRRRKKPDQPSK
jgi:transposase